MVRVVDRWFTDLDFNEYRLVSGSDARLRPQWRRPRGRWTPIASLYARGPEEQAAYVILILSFRVAERAQGQHPVDRSTRRSEARLPLRHAMRLQEIRDPCPTA